MEKKLSRKILLLFFLLVLIGDGAAASAQEVNRLAILDLQANGIPEVFALGLSDKLRSHVSQLIQNDAGLREGYEIVERTQIDKILDQFDLQNAGCVSDSCAIEFGKLLQCNRIILGSVSLIGETYLVAARIVDVESGKSLRASDHEHRGAIDDVLTRVIPLVGDELITGRSAAPQSSPAAGASPSGNEQGPPESVLGIDFVRVPAGTFIMGFEDGDRDERPAHTVFLDGFIMSATEITQGQYQAVTGKNPSDNKKGASHPVENLQWREAVEFCNKLSELVGLEPCYDTDTWTSDFAKNGFRLPTEAEWEYACRAGETTLFAGGDGEEHLAAAGWYRGNSDDTTQPVKGMPPNAWGLFDMHGNVAEWCNDAYGRYEKEAANNPAGPDDDRYRIIRGGSFRDEFMNCRASKRSFNQPRHDDGTIGFRIVRRE